MDRSIFIQYARSHGLTKEHQAVSPISLIHLPSDPLVENSPLTLSELRDALPHFTNIFEAREQLHVTKDVGVFLANVLKKKQYQLAAEVDKWQLRKGMLLEEPMLRYHEDNKLEAVELWNLRLPIEKLDEGLGEGSILPSSFFAAAAQFATFSELEKLQMRPEEIQFLKNAMAIPALHGHIRHEYEYKHDKIYDSLTPPLSPSFRPVIPMFPNLQVQLQPLDDAAQTQELFAELTNNIFASEPEWDDCDLAKYCPLFEKTPSIAPSPKRDHSSLMRLETLLIPPATRPRKRVKFADFISEIPLPSPYYDQGENHMREETSTLQQVDGNFAGRVINELKRQQPDEDDTTLTVSVPMMNFEASRLEAVGVEMLPDVNALLCVGS